MSVHGLQPKCVVLQRYRSYPLSSRCCSILSDFQTATRCSSAFRIDGSPEPRSTSAFEVCCSRSLANKRPSPSSRRSLRPGIARLDIPLHRFKTFLSSSMGGECGAKTFIGRRDCVPVSSGVSQSPQSHQDLQSLFIVMFLVRSLTLLYVPTFFNENRPACTASESKAISRPGAVLALNQFGCACQGSPCCP